ncbi:MAG: hypothetical protein ABIK38_07710 [candidate division WOR-3 bacterium]
MKKKFQRLLFLGLACLSVVLVFAPSARAQSHLPGANFWGDSDNAAIDGPDRNALDSAVIGDFGLYSPIVDIYEVGGLRARTGLWQDLSGNGSPDGPDGGILDSWIVGDYSDLSGNPVELELLDGTTIVNVDPIDGGSIWIGARAPSSLGNLRPGWGVIFEIVATTCAGAQIYGRDVNDGTMFAGFTDRAYEYTAEPDFATPDPRDPNDTRNKSGYARVRVDVPNTCTTGQYVEIEVYIPADSEFGLSGARHPFRLTALDHIFVEISNIGGQDTTPPITSLDSFPPDPSNSNEATFTFSSNEPGSSFECRLDGGGWSVCNSPANYSGLGEGSHTFEVRAIDPAGNPDPSPELYSWTIDTIAPETNLTSFPANPTQSQDASFTFNCNEASCAFECQLDSGGWSGCTSPASYSGLSEGIHNFQVRAIDSALNPDPSQAIYSWKVDRTAPETIITENPPALANSSTADFSFTCDDPPCTFECKLDSGGWFACSSPIQYSGLVNAEHTFQVRSTDEAGNLDPSPATYSWTVVADYWGDISTINAPAGRYWHTAVWTGTEMIIWGGNLGGTTSTDTGARYDPVNDSWTPTTTTNAPSARYDHTAVWADGGVNQMIVWGGNSGSGALDTGGRYDPSTDSWTATTTSGAPSARYWHTGIWTGSEMIIWGGLSGNNPTNTGGRYNPITHSWVATKVKGAPVARSRHTAVWTGSEMIIWGGRTDSGEVNTGGRYNPSSDKWTATSKVNAPSARRGQSAVWTGTKMIIWGGRNNTQVFNTGGIYDPSSNSWTATSTINAPSARVWFPSVWTGSVMIIWGGYNLTDALDDGAKYDPVGNQWFTISTANVPARYDHTGVWTGNELIIWGGWNGVTAYNDGFIMVPADNWP